MKIEIDIKGVIPIIKDYNKKRFAENYPNGEGLYAIEELGVIVGLVDVNNIRTNGENDRICDTYEYNLSFASIASIKENETISKVEECFKKVCDYIDERDNHLATFIGKEMDALKAEGIGGNGISEKTLLSALEIVTRNKGE